MHINYVFVFLYRYRISGKGHYDKYVTLRELDRDPNMVVFDEWMETRRTDKGNGHMSIDAFSMSVVQFKTMIAESDNTLKQMW